MIGAVFNEIFNMGDEVKAEKGPDSEAYKTIHELDRRIQAVYDRETALTREVLCKPPEGEDDMLVGMIDGLTVIRDDEGFRYRIDAKTCETPSEVLMYIIRDRNQKYRGLIKLVDDIIFKSVEQSAIRLYNRACADFHEAMDIEKPILRRAFREKVMKESE